MNNKMSIFVLSCDKYNDLWNDFFNLKDKYWSDCNYEWYLVNETKPYERKGINVVNCGKGLNWTSRLRKAVQSVDSQYIGLFLDDYFIYDTIDDKLIKNLVSFMGQENISFLNLGNVFRHILNLPNKDYYCEHLVIIPKHLKYGVDTSAAIWNRHYLLNKLDNDDCSAWQFELNRCEEASSESGYDGIILCDDRLPFNVSPEPVVIQGKFYPRAIKLFKDRGYNINTSERAIMSFLQVLKYKLKIIASRVQVGRKTLKLIGSTLFGYKFLTRD